MKPTLVFLHYFSGAASSWQYVIDLLEPICSCVAFDLPGFGGCSVLDSPSLDTYSRCVMQRLEGEGIHEAILVGHSMGGKIAMNIAATQTENATMNRCRVVGLALIAPSPATREPMDPSKKDQLESTHPDAEAAAKMVDESTVRPLTKDRERLAIETNLQSDKTAWRWWLRNGMEHSIASHVQKIRIPVAVLASEHDPVIPADVIQKDVVDLIPDCTATIATEVGHLMPMEDETMVADWIERQAALVFRLQT